MPKCNFCLEKFQSPQAIKAHLKHCSRSKTVKSTASSAFGKEPQADTTPDAAPPFQAGPQGAQADPDETK